MAQLNGIHHVTAISGPAQPNADFYTGFLGLRLVKRTVNFDDPGTYHLYYGDEVGAPGTILTFFPWAGVPRGRVGTGQVSVVSLSVPAHSGPYWLERAKEFGVPAEQVAGPFGESPIRLADLDGMAIELVPSSVPHIKPWKGSPVPVEHAIQGVHNLTLYEVSLEATDALLTGQLGYRQIAQEGDRYRYSVGEGVGTLLDVKVAGSIQRGMQGAGSVHHIAFRTPDGANQKEWRQQLTAAGSHVSPVMDRNYFTSIYFREPGGVLFEIATDGPGFSADEPVETLGSHLKLPLWLEEERAQIEASLPSLKATEVVRS